MIINQSACVFSLSYFLISIGNLMLNAPQNLTKPGVLCPLTVLVRGMGLSLNGVTTCSSIIIEDSIQK